LKTFPLISRPSFWAFIGTMSVLITAYAVFCFIKADYPPAIGFSLFVLMLAVFVYPTRIEVDAREIRLRSGLFISRRLKLADVVRIRKAQMTGALSLRKEPGFRVEGARLTINACVADPAAFLKTLEESVPDLHLYGDEYRRT
jgi:hypothetical protein